MCDYCEKGKPLLDHGACKVEIYHDGYDWMLSVTARQEDRWYGDIVEETEIYACPFCGRELRGDA